MSRNLTRLQNLVRKQFRIDPTKIKLEADFEKELDVLKLVMAIEDEIVSQINNSSRRFKLY